LKRSSKFYESLTFNLFKKHELRAILDAKYAEKYKERVIYPKELKPYLHS